jgi:hypothetical protein
MCPQELPLVTILSQMNPVLYSISLRSILILSSYLHLGLPTHLFPSGFPTKTLYAFHFFSMHATYLALVLIKKG